MPGLIHQGKSCLPLSALLSLHRSSRHRRSLTNEWSSLGFSSSSISVSRRRSSVMFHGHGCLRIETCRRWPMASNFESTLKSCRPVCNPVSSTRNVSRREIPVPLWVFRQNAERARRREKQSPERMPNQNMIRCRRAHCSGVLVGKMNTNEIARRHTVTACCQRRWHEIMVIACGWMVIVDEDLFAARVNGGRRGRTLMVSLFRWRWTSWWRRGGRILCLHGREIIGGCRTR